VVPPNNTGSTSHSLAGDGSGTSGYLQHDYTNKPEGTNVNVLPPMNLEISDNSDSLAPVKYVFDFNLRCNNIPNNSLVLKKPGSSPIPGAMQLLMNDYGSPPGNCTLEAPYGFGAYYNENGATQMSLVAPANAAYNTNAGYCPPPNFNGSPTVINLLKTTEHPGSNSWVGSAQGNNYNAWNNTGTDRHVFTDLVVNIGNPGTWPYNQPLTPIPSRRKNQTPTFKEAHSTSKIWVWFAKPLAVTWTALLTSIELHWTAAAGSQRSLTPTTVRP
jgi:hypothetical protein